MFEKTQQEDKALLKEAEEVQLQEIKLNKLLDKPSQAKLSEISQ